MQEKSQTTVTNIPSTSVLRYDLGERYSSFEKTNLNTPRERKSPFVTVLNPRTEEAPGTESAKILSFPIEKPQVNAALAQTKNYVTGVIVSYDEISVRCELDVSGKVVSIQLPRSLFPENINYGLPINLEMIDEGGFRRPLITLRKIDLESAAEIADEFDSILKSF